MSILMPVMAVVRDPAERVANGAVSFVSEHIGLLGLLIAVSGLLILAT